MQNTRPLTEPKSNSITKHCHGLLGRVSHTTVHRALNYIKDFTNGVQDTLGGRVDKDNPTEVKGEYNFPPTSHVNLNLSHERL